MSAAVVWGFVVFVVLDAVRAVLHMTFPPHDLPAPAPAALVRNRAVEKRVPVRALRVRVSRLPVHAHVAAVLELKWNHIVF